jgi:hypothetical protein
MSFGAAATAASSVVRSGSSGIEVKYVRNR